MVNHDLPCCLFLWASTYLSMFLWYKLGFLTWHNPKIFYSFFSLVFHFVNTQPCIVPLDCCLQTSTVILTCFVIQTFSTFTMEYLFFTWQLMRDVGTLCNVQNSVQYIEKHFQYMWEQLFIRSIFFNKHRNESVSN